MTQDQQQKKAAGRDPNREHMTLSELWQLWRDNLMSWRSFCDEHHDLFTLNIQAGFRRIGRWLSDLRSNARALAAPPRDRRFPESEYGAAQLFLFFRGSLERRAAAIREGFSNRRKALTWMGGKRRHFFEKMHLHPAAFLCGAVVYMVLNFAEAIVKLFGKILNWWPLLFVLGIICVVEAGFMYMGYGSIMDYIDTSAITA